MRGIMRSPYRTRRTVALISAAASLLLAATGVGLAAGAAGAETVAPRVSPLIPTCSSITPIAYGTAPLKAKISVAGQVDCFTFTGVIGDAAATDIAVTSGTVSPFEDIFRPDGTSACGGPFGGTGGSCPINQNGTWTLELSDSFGTHTGKMNISIQRFNSAVNCKAITFGAKPITGKLAAPAAFSCFTFTGNAGDVFYVRAVGISGTLGTPTVTLTAPDGSKPCGISEFGALDCPLSETGTQSLVLWSSLETPTGSFHISDQRLTAPAHCPTLVQGGASMASSIATAGQMRCFKFSGTTSEHVTVTLTGLTGTFQPLIDMFRPSGTSAAANPGTSVSFTLDVTGTWTVLIWDNNGPGTGNFTITLT